MQVAQNDVTLKTYFYLFFFFLSFFIFHSFHSFHSFFLYSSLIIRPNGTTFKVSNEDFLIPKVKPGDIVTYAFNDYYKKDTPVNVKVYRKRSDLSWEDVINNYEREKRCLNGLLLFHFIFFLLSLLCFFLPFICYAYFCFNINCQSIRVWEEEEKRKRRRDCGEQK